MAGGRGTIEEGGEKGRMMPSLEGPCFSLGAHGTLADVLTFQGGRKRPRVIRRPVPTDVGSDGQIRMRSIFFVLAELWNASTDAEKNAWRCHRDYEGNYGKDAWTRVGLRRAVGAVKGWVKEVDEPGFPWDGDPWAFVFLFDEGGGGVFVDLGDKGYRLTPVARTTVSRDGLPYYEGLFGDSDIEHAGYAPTVAGGELSACTIVADVVATDGGATHYVGGYERADWATRNLMIRYSSVGPTYQVFVKATGEAIVEWSSPGDSEWHRMGAVYNGSLVSGYLDGEVVDTEAGSGPVDLANLYVVAGAAYVAGSGLESPLITSMDRLIVSGVARPSLLRRIGVW